MGMKRDFFILPVQNVENYIYICKEIAGGWGYGKLARPALCYLVKNLPYTWKSL